MASASSRASGVQHAEPASTRHFVGTAGLMGLKTKEYGKWYTVVEVNYTFHQRSLRAQDFRALATQMRAAGLQCVVKVSVVATHENLLRHPTSWWPGLWEGYSELQQGGVLAALLWQCPPSLVYTEATLADLACLCKLLRETTGSIRHVFDFRQRSWYSEPRSIEVLRSHDICLAWLHVCNDGSRWAGDLDNGWSTSARTADFVYMRLFGSKGRSIGKYPQDFLRNEIQRKLAQIRDAFVIFGQGDVPGHALENGWETRGLLDRSETWTSWQVTGSCHEAEQSEGRPLDGGEASAAATPGLPTTGASEHSLGKEVAGTVTRVEDGRIFVNIGAGQEAVLGARHVGGGRTLHANLSRGKRQGRMRFHAGEVLSGLQVEAVDARTGLIYLSAAVADTPLRVAPKGHCRDSGQGVRVWKPVGQHQGGENVSGTDNSDGSISEQGGAGFDPSRLPSAAALGASKERQITITTWGNSRMSKPPEAQAHITCNYKKFHYLTRNNKHIKKLNGLHDEVQGRVCRNGFLESWLREVVSRIEREDLSSLCLHCHKGTHLSVAIAEILHKAYYPFATVTHTTLTYVRPGHVGGPARH
eukprot:TRINITY_DN55827_c0_g1_i1.p1 TRINITY_DN55827_c0_g1~~TRINITY_DN55827_c0_g1_i1.p1  ORF type:complete len:587 (-),score=77.91 TRINITY_DN55827_c0_g1_i1:170-1930(-)